MGPPTAHRDPAAWRAALRVREYAWGKPKDELAVELETPENPLDVARMPREQRQELVRKIAAQHPDLVERLLGPAAVAETSVSATPAAPPASIPDS